MQTFYIISHDRPVDRRPASSAHGRAGKVVVSDVPGRVQVGVQREAALSADKLALRTSVASRYVSAFVALLACVAWVTKVYADTPSECLVQQETFEPGKAPRVETTSLLLAGLHTISDIGQVFQDDGCAGLLGPDDALGEHMVTVFAETVEPSAELFEMSLGRFGAFRLKLPAQSEGTGLDFTPAALAEEQGSADHGRTFDPEVYAYRDVCRNDLEVRSLHDDVEEQSTFLADAEVGGADLPVDVPLIIGGDRERNMLPSLDAGQRDSAIVKLDVGRSGVIPDGTHRRRRARDFFAFLFECSGRLEGFGGLDSRLADKLGREIRGGSLGVVGQFVDLNAVDAAQFPPDGADPIERLGEQVSGLAQDGVLLIEAVEPDLDCALSHIHMLTRVAARIK